MKYQIQQEDQRDMLLGSTSDFVEGFHNKQEELSVEDQQVVDDLQTALTNSRVEESTRHQESIDNLVSSYNIFLSLDTIEIIQAMIVLPFEHQRFQDTHDFEHKNAYLGEIEFWYYQLRDLHNSLTKASSK